MNYKLRHAVSESVNLMVVEQIIIYMYLIIETMSNNIVT
jgi:hypothetical protein